PEGLTCGPNTTKTWTISSSILNILWGDVWPRLIALWWRRGSAVDPVALGPIGDAALKKAFHELVIEEAAANGLPVPGLNAVWNGTRLQRRLERVKKYFMGLDADYPTPIPVTFVGECAYDFLLSDAGLLLFAPLYPETEYELYRYYSFRRTGRASLGLPSYLKGTLAFDVDSPTGPGQIITTPNALDNTIVSGTCSLGELPCLHPQKVPPIDRLQDDHSDDDHPIPTWRNKPHIAFSFSNLVTALAPFRCWQLEGAVYRAIMVELPRVVAEIWMENKSGAAAFAKSYSGRFDPANPKAREIFMERVETSLPSEDKMVFQAEDGLVDVEISNQGIRFPKIDIHGPSWVRMLDEIAQGSAGNPVFTDSRRPEGDE
ncbi:MAG TPA: hypothetical protein VLA36_16365, partial [Longimicrobiales bacterium]|nr:hypothetical protein [Longimicrobiales bacterium]